MPKVWAKFKEFDKEPGLTGFSAFFAHGTALATTKADNKLLSRNETVHAARRNQESDDPAGGFHAARAAPSPAEPAAPNRALVAVTPVAETREPLTVYRQAAFLAQLLAIKDQHPQTRERRRADPEVAIAAYRATAALTTS